MSATAFTTKITLISNLNPSSLSRTWQTVPHPSRPMVATCSSDKTVRIYSLTSFTLLSTISGSHERSVRCAAWKPALKTESQLASGSFDRSVCIWRRMHDDPNDTTAEGIDEEEPTAAAKPARPAKATSQDAMELDFTPQNEDEDEDWTYFCILEGPDSEIKSVSWSAGGNLLALSSRDKSIWVWEEVAADDYETIAMLQEHTGDVKTVAWHPEEELLASGSYDDDVRLWRECADEWECVALLAGHESTVWMVEWEGVEIGGSLRGNVEGDVGMEQGDAEGDAERRNWLDRRRAAGPRLVSCSDDISVRVWRRIPKERDPDQAQSAFSTIRTNYHLEDWTCEAILPKLHDRALYAVAWSSRSGRIASAGGDGKIVVYEERWRGKGHEEDKTSEQDVAMKEDGVELNGEKSASSELTEWVVVAELEEAHDVYEINHVAWAPRADKGKSGKPGEEVLITTGDEGTVKVWALE